MTLGLKIPKKQAETTRRLLIQKGLLDKKHKVIRDHSFVYFPLLHVPEFNEVLNGEIVELDFPLSEASINFKNYVSSKLPSDLIDYLPSSWDQIGNTIVIELHSLLEPYKSIIAEGILKSHPHIVGVFEKVSSVSGTMRVRKLELLAGQDPKKVIHKEYGIRLVVDLHDAYFSPRLGLEHHLVGKMVTPREKVVDLFTGVGAFPLHIASNVDSEIYAIDINPHAIACLKESIQLNQKFLKGEIHPICSDSRQWASEFDMRGIFDRVIMNHPSKAYDFLDLVPQLLKPNGILHFYSFESENEWQWSSLVKLSEEFKKYGRRINEVLRIRKVRLYSPRSYHVSTIVRIS